MRLNGLLSVHDPCFFFKKLLQKLLKQGLLLGSKLNLFLVLVSLSPQMKIWIPPAFSILENLCFEDLISNLHSWNPQYWYSCFMDCNVNDIQICWQALNFIPSNQVAPKTSYKSAVSFLLKYLTGIEFLSCSHFPSFSFYWKQRDNIKKEERVNSE